MENEFIFGLVIAFLVIMIAFLWTGIVYLKAVIRNLRHEIEKLRAYIYDIINNAGRGDN